MTIHFQNPYLPHTLRSTTTRQAPVKQVPLFTLDSSGLPIGTAAQVMEWVGDDPDRALRFLNKEQEEARPRVSLEGNLKEVLKPHEIQVVEPPPEQAVHLAPQIDVIPAERIAIAEGEPLAMAPVDPLTLIREKLGIETEER